jgi:hypothetical protein
MENNIFVKMKREKYNPDVDDKLKGKESEREKARFELTTSIYNPITGQVPAQIRSNNDLILQKDTAYSSIDIKKLIMEKENERINQDIQYKPIKTKVINNNPQSSQISIGNSANTSNTNDNYNQQPRTNYIETYEELKKGSSYTKNEQDKAVINNKEKYNNILDGLKDLGIIK